MYFKYVYFSVYQAYWKLFVSDTILTIIYFNCRYDWSKLLCHILCYSKNSSSVPLKVSHNIDNKNYPSLCDSNRLVEFLWFILAVYTCTCVHMYTAWRARLSG